MGASQRPVNVGCDKRWTCSFIVSAEPWLEEWMVPVLYATMSKSDREQGASYRLKAVAFCGAGQKRYRDDLLIGIAHRSGKSAEGIADPLQQGRLGSACIRSLIGVLCHVMARQASVCLGFKVVVARGSIRTGTAKTEKERHEQKRDEAHGKISNVA